MTVPVRVLFTTVGTLVVIVCAFGLHERCVAYSMWSSPLGGVFDALIGGPEFYVPAAVFVILCLSWYLLVAGVCGDRRLFRRWLPYSLASALLSVTIFVVVAFINYVHPTPPVVFPSPALPSTQSTPQQP